MNTLIILNKQPYDGTDVIWNGLRLADNLLNLDVEVRLFLMNDSVDIARDTAEPPDGYFDLPQLLKDLIDKGIALKVCGTCKARCGVHKGDPYFEGAVESTMVELAKWVKTSDRVITF